MSIYAANRMGHVSTATAVANESYGANDIGQILYESQLNDQALFEAIVVSDLRELKGIREGTLLESEITALNEASIKGFFENVKARLKKFWEKVKGVFKNVIAKIAVFVAKDGKKFVKVFESNYKGFKGEPIKNCRLLLFGNTGKEANDYFDFPEVESIKKEIEAKKNAEKIDKTAIIAEELAKSIGRKGKSYSPKEYKIEVKKMLFDDQTRDVDERNVTAVINYAKDILNTGAKSIKDLRDMEKDIEKGIKKAEKEIKDAEKAALGDSPSKEAKKDNSNVIRNISALVSAYEQVTSIVMGTATAAVRANIRNAYSILNKIMHQSMGSSSVTTESACIVAEETFDDALNTNMEELDQDTKEAIENVIDAADPDIKDE